MVRSQRVAELRPQSVRLASPNAGLKSRATVRATAAPPADTRRASDSAPDGASPEMSDSAPCGASSRQKCLHVLSSFQRTGVLTLPHLAPSPSSGEPYETTKNLWSCQTLLGSRTGGWRRRALIVASGFNRKIFRLQKRKPHKGGSHTAGRSKARRILSLCGAASAVKLDRRRLDRRPVGKRLSDTRRTSCSRASRATRVG